MITVGRYQLVEKLGQGGMGVVYRAFDTLLQRVVAVKIILGMIEPGSEQRERFFREARAAGQLSHRNIITIHDLGEHEGQPYLAMEYLEGEDLQRRLSRPAPLSLAQKLELAIQVSEGLDYAHAHGIVHRDVKPANIFITVDGTAKILDFGLARLMTSELTHSKFMMGTINYMAPEQVIGERADHRADIFAFGVVLYELLGGRKAFDGDSAAATLYKIVEASPEPLPQIDPTLPAELVAVVDRALAKSRDQRYQQMSDVLADLVICRQQLVPPESPAAGRPGSGGSLRGPVSARPLHGVAGPPTLPPANSTDETALVPDVSPPGSGGQARAAAPPRLGTPAWALAAITVLVLAVTAAWLWRSPGAPPAAPAADVADDQSPAPAAAALALANEALDAGRPEDAQRHVEAALAASPDDAEARRIRDRIATVLGNIDRTMRDAQEHFDAGRYAEASRAAGTVLGLSAAHPGAQQLMADATARLQGRGADDARRRMVQSKASARAASAATLAPAAYNAALGAEQSAQRAFDAGELDTATARFYEASGLFRSAEVSAQSEAAARADRARAARVEQERLEKERAERERADQEQRDRDRAERERLAAQAAAASKPEPVRQPPPPPTKPPAAEPPAKTAPPEPRAETLITNLLAQYESAFEARSLGDLQRLWPTLAGAQEAAIRSEFEHASRIAVGITSPRIEVVGGTATATFIREYDLVTIDGQRLSSRSLTTISCRRTAAGWVIEQIRYEPVR